MSFTRQAAIIIPNVRVEAEGNFHHQTTECRYPTVLPSITDIASSNAAYNNWLVIDLNRLIM